MIWRSCPCQRRANASRLIRTHPVRFLHISNISKPKTHHIWDDRPDPAKHIQFISDFTLFRCALSYNAGRVVGHCCSHTCCSHFVTDTIKIVTKVWLFLICQGLKLFTFSKKVARKIYWTIRNSTPPKRTLAKDKVPLGKEICPNYWNKLALPWENISQLLNLRSIYQAMGPALNNTNDCTASLIV